MYRAAHTLKPDDIEKLASANVSVQKSTADTFAEGGQFLPLDVWRKQGFQINEENISEEDKSSARCSAQRSGCASGLA